MNEVVVIGGGIAGAAVALELQERGCAVNLVEASRPGSAATGASAGMLAPQYESAGPGPFFELLLRSRAEYPAFADRLGELAGLPLELRWDGMLVANLTDAEHQEAIEAACWQRAAGEAAEVIDLARASALEPFASSDALSYLWLPGEGQVDSQQLADALDPALRNAGVRVISGEAATEVVIRERAVVGVRLERGRMLEADVVVAAAGAWGCLLEGMGWSVPVRPVRGHLVRYPAGAAPLRRMVALHAGRYLVPRNDGSVLAGSTMDDIGFCRAIDEDGLAAVRQSAARLVPGLAAARPAEWWADLRPISADRLPILGPDPEVAGLFHATGYGRNGILLAPLAGRLLAEVVCGGDATQLPDGLLPARFAVRPAGPAVLTSPRPLAAPSVDR
jgi:glycine oxidase